MNTLAKVRSLVEAKLQDIAAKTGQPIAFDVYHGTGMAKPHSHWFTTHRGQAEDYARTSAEAFGGKATVFHSRIEAKNPHVVDPDTAEWLPYEKQHVDRIKKAGHDVIMTSHGHETFVLDPSIVKSTKIA